MPSLPRVEETRDHTESSVVTEPYTIREFRGHYRAHKICSKYPIPGTQLRVEQDRIRWRKHHRRKMENDVKNRIKEEGITDR